MKKIGIELKLISKLDHMSVLKYIGFSPINFKNEPRPVMITELTSNRTLEEILKSEYK